MGRWLSEPQPEDWKSIRPARAKLLFRASQGRLIKIYGEINPWAREIAQRLLVVSAGDAPSA